MNLHEALHPVTRVETAPDTLNRYTVDGLTPAAVALPATEAEVAAVLQAAAARGAAVVPWGAGSAQDYGNPLERADLVLSLERLNQVVEYTPADMTITVQAGARLADVQALTARHGQTLPLDPPGADRATVGGIVARAASGPRRMAYGGVRDLLLGTRLALPDGRLIKTGGRVVKNVAGYDMNKLVAGSLGTLAVITEVTLKLRPLPASSCTLLLGFADATNALEAAEGVLNSELLPAALTVLTPGIAGRLGAPGPFTLAIALEETAENVAYQLSRLPRGQTLVAEAEARFWDRVRNWQAPVRMRVNTVIADLVNRFCPGTDAVAHVGTGTVLLYGDFPLEGTVLEHAPLAIRRTRDVWGAPRPEWRLMQEIKRTFDPGRTLNPGRFVGGM